MYVWAPSLVPGELTLLGCADRNWLVGWLDGLLCCSVVYTTHTDTLTLWYYQDVGDTPTPIPSNIQHKKKSNGCVTSQNIFGHCGMNTIVSRHYQPLPYSYFHFLVIIIIIIVVVIISINISIGCSSSSNATNIDAAATTTTYTHFSHLSRFASSVGCLQANFEIEHDEDDKNEPRQRQRRRRRRRLRRQRKKCVVCESLCW